AGYHPHVPAPPGRHTNYSHTPTPPLLHPSHMLPRHRPPSFHHGGGDAAVAVGVDAVDGFADEIRQGGGVGAGFGDVVVVDLQDVDGLGEDLEGPAGVGGRVPEVDGRVPEPREVDAGLDLVLDPA